MLEAERLAQRLVSLQQPGCVEPLLTAGETDAQGFGDDVVVAGAIHRFEHGRAFARRPLRQQGSQPRQGLRAAEPPHGIQRRRPGRRGGRRQECLERLARRGVADARDDVEQQPALPFVFGRRRDVEQGRHRRGSERHQAVERLGHDHLIALHLHAMPALVEP